MYVCMGGWDTVFTEPIHIHSLSKGDKTTRVDVTTYYNTRNSRIALEARCANVNIPSRTNIAHGQPLQRSYILARIVACVARRSAEDWRESPALELQHAAYWSTCHAMSGRRRMKEIGKACTP
jgi:hypothetical protein